MLHADAVGEGDPVVLLHGFTQTGASWAPIAASLTERHRVVTIDAPGHGRSSNIRADLTDGADMMVAAAPSPAKWIGYSMGGRFLLQVALRHPGNVMSVVLVSTTAGIEDPQERDRRRESDRLLADRVRALGVERFLDEWLSQPLFSTLRSDAAGIESRLNCTPEGLASSLALAGAAEQEPVWDSLRTLSMPVLVVAGGLDRKYVALSERLVDRIGPNSRLHIIEGAGHACHLEQPQAFLAAVRPFLEGPQVPLMDRPS